MSFLQLLQSLSGWSPIVYIRDSKFGMPTVQSFHLMGLTMLLTTVLVLNLRLTGLGMKSFELPRLARQLKPWTLGSLALVLSSGLLIFLATPDKYLDSRPFRFKMAFLALAIVFHFGVLRRFVAVENLRPRLVVILIACVSLTLWFGVGWAGRAIAFVP